MFAQPHETFIVGRSAIIDEVVGAEPGRSGELVAGVKRVKGVHAPQEGDRRRAKKLIDMLDDAQRLTDPGASRDEHEWGPWRGDDDVTEWTAEIESASFLQETIEQGGEVIAWRRPVVKLELG